MTRFRMSRTRAALLAVMTVLLPVAIVRWLPRSGGPMAPGSVESMATLCDAFMERGIDEARSGNYDAAMDDLHSAIDEAPTAEWRAKAAQRMGHVLTIRARVQAGPYGMMAQQYLLAAMRAVKHDSFIYEESVRMLIEAAALAEDRTIFGHVARQLLDSTKQPEGKEAIYRQWIKDRIDTGTYRQAKELMDEAEAQLPERTGKSAFGFLRVAMVRKLLENDAWFQEYRAKDLDRDPREVRAEVAREAIQWLEKQAVLSPETKGECHFQLLAIHYSQGAWAEAKPYLRMFLQEESSKHLDESLLITAGLARHDGDLKNASQAMRVFVRRYKVSAPAERELLTIVDSLEEKGSLKEAYDLLKESVNPSSLAGRNLSSLIRAAKMAGRLGRNAEAWQHYRVLVARRAPQAIIRDLLLTEADLCLDRKEFTEAKKWLLDYLQIARFDTNRAEGLFRLFLVQQKENAPLAEALLTGIAASHANSANICTIEPMLAVAKQLEDLGLYGTAAARFRGIAMLGHVGISTNSRALVDMVGLADVGEARCLLKSGEKVKADRRFREICRGTASPVIKSMAAYWWATIAVDETQGKEAIRRLSLMSTNGLDRALLARAEIDRKLAQALGGADWKTVTDDIFRLASEMPPREQEESLQRACRVLFDKMEGGGNVEGMQYVLSMAVQRPVSKEPFFRELLLRLVTITIRDRNASVLVDFMKPYLSGPQNEIQTISRDEPVLVDVYRQFQEIRPEAERCL